MNQLELPIEDSLPSTKPAPATTEESEPPRKPRGFAAIDRARVREIASLGGKAAHRAGTAHQFNTEEARAAGKKGGAAPHTRRGRGKRTQ